MLDFDLTMALAFALGVGVGVGLVVLCCLCVRKFCVRTTDVGFCALASKSTLSLLSMDLFCAGVGVGVGVGCPALAAPLLPARAIAVIANVFSSVFLILIFNRVKNNNACHRYALLTLNRNCFG